MSSKSRREKLNCVPASPPSSKLIFLGRFKQLRRVNMTAVIFWASPLDRMALAIHHYVQPTYRFRFADCFTSFNVHGAIRTFCSVLFSPSCGLWKDQWRLLVFGF